MLAAGLAMTAAALAATGAGGAFGAASGDGSRARASADTPSGTSPPGRGAGPRPAVLVSAPVRIADAATARLLRRGDRVDVIAAPFTALDGAERARAARVVAAGARVVDIPGPATGTDAGDWDGAVAGGTATTRGALVVLSVPRTVAAELAGASATSHLAVTLC